MKRQRLQLVRDGALLLCDQGTSPSALGVVDGARTEGAPVATDGDHIAMVNIRPFGLCTTMLNPQVLSATTAAQGVLTPVPCVPMTTQLWQGTESRLKVRRAFALTSNSTCRCLWNGSISVVHPGTRAEVT